MLNQIISTMMKTFIITEIDILYLQTKMDLCKTKCENSSGHLPYLFEGMSLVQPYDKALIRSGQAYHRISLKQNP